MPDARNLPICRAAYVSSVSVATFPSTITLSDIVSPSITLPSFAYDLPVPLHLYFNGFPVVGLSVWIDSGGVEGLPGRLIYNGYFPHPLSPRLFRGSAGAPMR